jgi:protein TonB
MPHRDVLDEREPVRTPFLASLGLHAALFGLIAGAGWAASQDIVQWGDPNSLGGGAVGITPVARVPLPARAGIVNPVANDTESVIPAKPKPEPKKTARDDRDAIPIQSKNAPRRNAPDPASNQKYRPNPLERSNQVYSSTGAAAVSPIYSLAPGGGGVGSGSQNPFGQGFGQYAQLIRDKVARNWRTEQVDSRLRAAPPVIVVFDLHRDGSVRNYRVEQSSGNFALDQSALRAVAQSSPFPPLPPGLPRPMYTINLEFRLKR